MKFLQYGKDGGPLSRVWAFTFLEIKPLFSILLLKFEDGSREVFHTHAFNSVSWLLSGTLVEFFREGKLSKRYFPSVKPIVTKRLPFHQVKSVGRSYALSFRGPWKKNWNEYHPNEDKYLVLTNHRVIIN